MELSRLPVDALARVLAFLPVRDIMTAALACKALRQATMLDDLWLAVCKRWETDVPLEEWKAKCDSPAALCRLLTTLDSLVGTWSAQELQPYGGLVCITWGSFGAIAYRVLLGWTAPNGLVCRRLFEVNGASNGSCSVTLLAGRGEVMPEMSGLREEVALPGNLVWGSTVKEDFHLETMCWLTKSRAKTEELAAEARKIGYVMKGDPEEEEYDEDDEQLLELQPGVMGARIEDSVRMLLTRHMWVAAEQSHPYGELPYENTDTEDIDGFFATSAEHLWHFVTGKEAQQVEGEQPAPKDAADAGIKPAGCMLVQEKESSVATRSGVIQVPFSQYRRLLPARNEEGTELAGLWTAWYGPHGEEVVDVTYTSEEIVATKVLGDPNVPSGEVTFKVTLASVSTESLPDGPQLENHSSAQIVRMYQGSGRIASVNFQDPEWISGRLLVDADGKFSFIWDDDGAMVGFRRFNLSDYLQTLAGDPGRGRAWEGAEQEAAR